MLCIALTVSLRMQAVSGSAGDTQPLLTVLTRTGHTETHLVGGLIVFIGTCGHKCIHYRQDGCCLIAVAEGEHELVSSPPDTDRSFFHTSSPAAHLCVT